MAGLQRSEISFRRQGSSGLIWDDGKLISGELKKTKDARLVKSASVGHGGYRAANSHINKDPLVASSVDPPSPRVSGCGLCKTVFGKPVINSAKKKRKPTQFVYKS